MAQPIVCEYFIQNDEYDSNHKHNPYPNVFLLPQKYNNVTDVRVSDIISAFPLNNSDPLHKYVLRFETVLQISATKRINAWMDLENQLDIAVPNVKGKIRIKALRLPRGIEPKQIPSQPRYHKQSDSNPNSNRASSIGMQQQSKLPQNPYPQQQQQQQQQPHQYMYQQPKQQEQKSSFPDLTSVFQKVGGLFYGQEEQKEEFPRQTNTKQSNNTFSQQQQQFQQEQQQQYNQQTVPPQKQDFQNIFDDHDTHQNIPTEGNAWDKFDNFGQSQNTNLLFTEGDDDDNNGFQQMNNQSQQPTSENTGGFNIFDNDDVPTSTQGSYQAPSFGNFASSHLLGDLNFGPDPVQQQTQDPTQGKGGEKASSLQGSGGSRIDHVQAIFQAQQQQKVNWEKAYQQHEERINNWIGRGPMKNHVRVLLCTLDQVLWQGNGWERVGMDKLLDPQKVKLYYRKATMLCHPDKLGNSEENPDKVYIANRCFAAITEAYNIFKKEEGIN